MFAIERYIPVEVANDHHHPVEVKAKQEVISQSSYLEASSKVSFTSASFLLLWISKFINFPQLPINTYKHYKAFFGNAYMFNAYYTYTSALAP
ncbi:hypothetical protein [Catalinimonas niigatensis]|uniref:hypothetical protein n=1 Tax=Catalinimonas niigatensis TaxID=1397264 RepID=UPI0026655D59|nr:hypothetical protein [Catalinimonas niigatensis]WPP52418.1 hypothetical protein PZB72_08485 [Catalinimonas niigatensis]